MAADALERRIRNDTRVQLVKLSKHVKSMTVEEYEREHGAPPPARPDLPIAPPHVIATYV